MEKAKKPIYLRWYMWLVYIFGAIVVFSFLLPNQNYQLGMKAYEKKDFKEAYESFLKVPTNNENYQNAQSKINELKPIYDSLIIVEKIQKDAELKAKIEKEKFDKKQKDSLDRIESVKEVMKKLPISVENEIKKLMHDPKSFEIVEYKWLYTYSGDIITIEIKFRGKNPLGNLVNTNKIVLAKGDGTFITFM